jgi:signal transduction histidine kinase
MKKTAIRFFIFLSCSIVGNLFAQYLSEDYRSNQCIITQLNTENGLPSNAITGLAWEKNGQLIFTTEGGIVRFNGQQIIIDSLSIPFFRLLRTADKNLVALSRAGSAYEIRNGEICEYYTPKDSRNNRFTLSNLGAIGLESDLFYKSLQAEHPPFYWFNRPEAYRVKNKIIYNELNNLHICSADGKYNLATLPKDTYYSRFVEIANKPYLLNRKCQLRLIDIERGITQEIPIQNNPFSEKDYPVQYFYEYGQLNPIIIVGNKAWIIFENPEGVIEMKLISECIPSGILIKHAEYVTEHQMLLLGTESHGLFIIKKDYFKQSLPNKLLPELGTAFYLQVPINEQYILSNWGYLVGSGETPLRPGMGLQEDLGNSWMKDSKGNYWYSQKDSIVKYEVQNRQKKCIAVIPVPAPEKKNYIEYKDTIYIGTSNGIYLAYNDKIIDKIEYPPNLTYISFPGDIELFQDYLYLSTCSGLFRYDPKTRKIEVVFQIKNTCLRDIWILNNTLFIGTYGEGIFRLQGNIIQRLPRDKYNFLAFTHCFMKDSNDFVWISTNRGIFRTTTQFLLQEKYTQTDKYQYIYYGREDGIKPTELNGGCTPCGIKIGSLFSFPSMDGLIQFDPLKVPIDSSNYPVQIEEIRINNMPVKWHPGRIIELSLEEGMEIDFSNPWWSNAQNLHLAYQIEGLDLQLIKLNYPNETSIKITRLPAGDYSVRIFRLNLGNGILSNKSYPILIHVDSPWYRKPLGIAFISLLTALFFWVVFQIRINRITEQKRKLSRLAWEKEHTVRTQKDHLLKTVERLRKSQVVLEENNRMKNHVISILSHDLVTPLKYIAIAGKGILNNPEKYDKNTLLEMISSIMNSANQLEILSTNVLNWIKYFRTNRAMTVKTFDLFEMIDRTRESLDMFIKRKGNTFYNNIPEGTFVTQIYEPLAVIIFNLTSNANKYTENGEISVDFELEKDYFYIYVSDSGQGIPPEKVQRILKGDPLESSPDTEMLKGNGLGYLLIRELIILIKGEIQIESEIGQGTTVTVKLPYLQLLP